MEATLLTAGLACVIAAIIGGGVKAWGIEIPALNSVKRQLLLVSFGGLLLLTLVVVRLSREAGATPHGSTGAGPSDASQATKPVVQPGQTQSPAAEIGTADVTTGKKISAVAAESRRASMSGTLRDSTAPLAKPEPQQVQNAPGKTSGTSLDPLWMGKWDGVTFPELETYTLEIRADGGRLSYSGSACDEVLTLKLHETSDPLTISYEITGDPVTRSSSLCESLKIFEDNKSRTNPFDDSYTHGESKKRSYTHGEIKGTTGLEEVKMSRISVPLKRVH